MKKILLVLSAIFTVLTFVGAIYVLVSGGEVNAGYAVIPCARFFRGGCFLPCGAYARAASSETHSQTHGKRYAQR